MDDAKDRVAYLNFYGDITSSIAFFVVGYISDNFVIWKLLTIVNILILGFHLVLVMDLSPDVC